MTPCPLGFIFNIMLPDFRGQRGNGIFIEWELVRSRNSSERVMQLGCRWLTGLPQQATVKRSRAFRGRTLEITRGLEENNLPGDDNSFCGSCWCTLNYSRAVIELCDSERDMIDPPQGSQLHQFGFRRQHASMLAKQGRRLGSSNKSPRWRGDRKGGRT